MDETLLVKVNKLLGKNYKYKSYLDTIEDLTNLVERQNQEYATLNESIGEADVMIAELKEEVKQYKLQESILLERLQKQTLQMKEMKQNSRLQRFYDMAEENLRMAQEIARLKESQVGGI